MISLPSKHRTADRGHTDALPQKRRPLDTDRGTDMINYDEELKKFTPSLEVDEAEGAIYSRDLTDVIDILREMLKETSDQEKGR